MNLTFYDEPFDIPDEWKITLWRFNVGDSSPFSQGAKKWDKNAKAVSADTPGFFCLQEEQLLTGHAFYAYIGYAPYLGFLEQNATNFWKIEADRRDILFAGAKDVALSKGNIVEVLTRFQFGKRFPVFPYVAEKKHHNTGINFYKEGCALMIGYCKEQSGKGVFSSPDGFPHSLRVEKGIDLLCERMGIRELHGMGSFAYWHDVMRAKGHDPEHGKRASEVIEQSRGRNKLEMVDVDRLAFACEHHSTMLRSGDPLIDLCFDADRLDLFYRGITPDPALMATEMGSYYAEHYDEYLTDIQKIRI